MKPENLVNNISLLGKYIERELKIVDKLEQSLDKITLEAMRKHAVDDIDIAYQKVMFEVEKEAWLTSPSSKVYISSGYFQTYINAGNYICGNDIGS